MENWLSLLILIIILTVFLDGMIKSLILMLNFIFNFQGRKWQKINNWASSTIHDWSSLNGIGKILYGHEDEKIIKQDVSYVTTLYICAFFIPLVPIYRYRVIKRDRNFWGSTKYDVLCFQEINSKDYPIYKYLITPLSLILCTSIIISVLYMVLMFLYSNSSFIKT